jgi:hypothetical protein
MLPRIIGVFMLRADTFEEIEHNTGATIQAAIIVAIVAVLSGIGSAIGASFTEGSFFGSFISSLIGVFIGWILWSGITYIVGTAVFGGKADMGEMLRVVGFAFAPQILGIVPVIGACIGWLWSLVAMYVAVRQGLDLSGGKTIATIVIGFIIYVVLIVCLVSVFGGLGAIVGG